MQEWTLSSFPYDSLLTGSCGKGPPVLVSCVVFSHRNAVCAGNVSLDEDMPNGLLKTTSNAISTIQVSGCHDMKCMHLIA